MLFTNEKGELVDVNGNRVELIYDEVQKKFIIRRI